MGNIGYFPVGDSLVLECVSALGAGVCRGRVVGFVAVFKEFPHILKVIGGKFVKHLSAIGASLCVLGAFHPLEFLIKVKDGSVAGGLVRASDILGHGVFSRGFVLCDVYGDIHITATPIGDSHNECFSVVLVEQGAADCEGSVAPALFGFGSVFGHRGVFPL